MKSSSTKNIPIIAYVGFGSNKGPSKALISMAIEKLSSVEKSKILKVSSLYRSAAVGGPKQADFLNGVIQVKTTLSAPQLLAKLFEIEKQLGRRRRVKWGPRRIDLDLLAYGKKIIHQNNLVVPHPRYHERRFVLIPFSELAPHFVHPVLKRKNISLLRELTPHGQRVTILRRWKK